MLTPGGHRPDSCYRPELARFCRAGRMCPAGRHALPCTVARQDVPTTRCPSTREHRPWQNHPSFACSTSTPAAGRSGERTVSRTRRTSPLPLKLTRDVLVWTRNFDHERGWPTAEQREASRHEGERLAGRVQDSVGPGVTLDLDMWEAHVHKPRLPRWLRMLTGLTPASSCEALVLGRRYAELPNPSRHVGVMLDAAAQHPGRTGREVPQLSATITDAGRARVSTCLRSSTRGRVRGTRRRGPASRPPAPGAVC